MRRFAIDAWLPRTIAPAAVWLTVGLAGVALVTTALGLFVHKYFHAGAIEELKPRQPYAVAVCADECRFDLNFNFGARYLVVIGSLGEAERRFNVECSSLKIPALRLGLVEPVFPLKVSPRAGADSDEQPDDLPPRRPLTGTHDVIPVNFSGTVTTRASDAQRIPSVTGSRSFALHVTDGSLDDPAQYVTIRANTVAEGQRVRIYLDEQQSTSELAPGLLADVIDLFDREIIPRFQGLLGTYRDVDHDGRFGVLLSPWLGRLQGGRTSVGGFVRGSDFQSSLGLPFSNRCDMMYVNSQTLPGPHLRTLLIHEYTHAVCFSRRTADSCGRPRFPEEEDWLNEAIAHCAESLFGGGWSNLDYRIARFLNDPSAYPLVVGDYYRAGLWRCHGCRGATYLFLRYCVERFGTETLTRLIANPARGIQNVERATGCSFDRLFRDWTLSLLDAADHPPSSESAEDCNDFEEIGQSIPESASQTGNSRSTAPTLAPLDLYGSLGNWSLAGPKRQRWDVDKEPEHVALKGTSAAYLELCATGAPGPRRLRLKSSVGSKLQISVIRVEDETPQIEVETARFRTPKLGEAVGLQATGELTDCECLHTVVRILRGEDVTIEQISAERNSGQTHSSICFASPVLNKLECSLAKTSPEVDRPINKNDVSKQSNGACNLRAFDLPAARLSAGDTPVVLKVVAADRHGRRATAWAVVPAHRRPQAEGIVQHLP